MTEEYVQRLLKEKIKDNEKIIKITLEELNLSIQDTSKFIEIAKIQLKKLGYKIYSPGTKYWLDDEEHIVNGGELIVAIG